MIDVHAERRAAAEAVPPPRARPGGAARRIDGGGAAAAPPRTSQPLEGRHVRLRALPATAPASGGSRKMGCAAARAHGVPGGGGTTKV